MKKKLIFITVMSLHCGIYAEPVSEDVFSVQEDPVDVDSVSEEEMLSLFESRYGAPETKREEVPVVKEVPDPRPATSIDEVFSVQEEPVQPPGTISDDEILSVLESRFGQVEKPPLTEPAPQPVYVNVPPPQPVVNTEVPIVCAAPPCETPPCSNLPCDDKVPFTIEARVSYLYPTSSLLRKIYHCGGIDYQLSATIPLYQGCNFFARGLNLWLAVDYFEKDGGSICFHNRTTIRMEPLTAGLKWIYPDACIRPYLGLGLKYYFLQVRNDSPYVARNTSVNTPGAVAELGTQFFFFDRITVDLFASYSYVQFDAPTNQLPNVRSTGLDASSFNIGAGFGFKF